MDVEFVGLATFLDSGHENCYHWNDSDTKGKDVCPMAKETLESSAEGGDLIRRRITELAQEITRISEGGSSEQHSLLASGRFEVTKLGTRVVVDDQIVGYACCCCCCCSGISIEVKSR